MKDYTELLKAIEKSRHLLGWNNYALNGIEAAAKNPRLGTMSMDIDILKKDFVKAAADGDDDKAKALDDIFAACVECGGCRNRSAYGNDPVRIERERDK